MNAESTSQAVALFGACAKAETAVGELYAVCARRWPSESDFWMHLSQQEANHAENLYKMITMIQKFPQFFLPKVLPEMRTVEGFESHIRATMAKVADESASYTDAMKEAILLEEGFLELNYSSLLETGDKVYNAMLKYFTKETKEHRAALQKRLQAGPPLSS